MVITSELQMDGKAAIIPLGKLYESSYAAPTSGNSRAAHYYEEHHAMQAITDY